jgi:hypothetical protein
VPNEASLPDGIEGHEGSDPAIVARGTWARRAFLGLLAVLVAAALANVFGQQPSTAVAATRAATLSVQAPDALRGGLLYQLKITVQAHEPLHDARLVLSTGWFESLTANAEVPQPSTQTSRDGQPVFDLGGLRAGERQTLWLYFQVNPVNAAWRRTTDVELDAGTTRIAFVHRTLTIYP